MPLFHISGNGKRSVTIKDRYPGKEQTLSKPTGCEVSFLVAKRFEMRVTARSRAEMDMLVHAFDFKGLEKLAPQN